MLRIVPSIILRTSTLLLVASSSTSRGLTWSLCQEEKETRATMLKGRVMKGTLIWPRELWRALDMNTLRKKSFSCGKMSVST